MRESKLDNTRGQHIYGLHINIYTLSLSLHFKSLFINCIRLTYICMSPAKILNAQRLVSTGPIDVPKVRRVE